MVEYSAKVLVIGNSGVGKTSLCNRFINDAFTRAFKPTIGVEFYTKEFTSENEHSKDKLLLHMWDVGGQERYIYMTHVYYKDADFCIIMFDLTNRESFKACARWKSDLDSKYSLEDGTKCPCFLIGNKCDIGVRAVSHGEIEDFCKEEEFFGYMELSVLQDLMVTETISYIATEIKKKKEKQLAEQQELINKGKLLPQLRNKLNHIVKVSLSNKEKKKCCF